MSQHRCACGKLTWDGRTGRHVRSFQLAATFGVLSVRCQCGRLNVIDLRLSTVVTQNTQHIAAAMR